MIHDVTEFLKKPTVLMAILLITILFIITLKYDNMQRELLALQEKVKKDETMEKEMKVDMGHMKNEIRTT